MIFSYQQKNPAGDHQDISGISYNMSEGLDLSEDHLSLSIFCINCEGFS